MSDVTRMLQAASRGEKSAADRLLPLVYDELRKLAATKMAREHLGQTLQPTALVHEAWLRLIKAGDRNWHNQSYFFSAAAEAMRRILVEAARRKATLKHGGGQQRLNIDEINPPMSVPDDSILQIDDALKQLEVHDPEQARVVVLKFFSGLTDEEVAKIMNISQRTVGRHWACAKDWLYSKISSNRAGA